MKSFNMPNVIFKLDIEKDAENYYSAVNSGLKWGHDFTKALKPAILEKIAITTKFAGIKRKTKAD